MGICQALSLPLPGAAAGRRALLDSPLGAFQGSRSFHSVLLARAPARMQPADVAAAAQSAGNSQSNDIR